MFHTIQELLFWTMLAASTVGPGTVVTCARAGAEYHLSLLSWLVVASLMAFTLQEGAARLTIVSGRSLGECLRAKGGGSVARLLHTSWLCWLVVVSVGAGNTLFSCNDWAGGVEAVLAFPGVQEGELLRWGTCLVYLVLVVGILSADKDTLLGIFCGVIMIIMVGLFLVLVVQMGETGKLTGLLPSLDTSWGFVPHNTTDTAAAPEDMVLSLVGTTSIGFNLFLAGEMAKEKGIGAMQRGIAFSTFIALLVSVLIMVVGGGVEDMPGGGDFKIALLSQVVHDNLGPWGEGFFGLGFIAASLSSMLAAPVGAALR